MIPCIYNLVSILTLFEIHIEGLTGIFYFYFTYFCLSISTCINKKSIIFLYLLYPIIVYKICFHKFNF